MIQRPIRMLLTLAALAVAASATAQPQDADQEQEFVPPFVRTAGPTTGNLGSLAIIQVPEGLSFLDGVNTGELLAAWGNIPSGEELGTLMPDQDMPDWAVVFEFDEIGYVPDDEKDELDADAMLETMREAQAQGNQERARRNLPTLTIDGWQTPPRYNSRTNNLEWALLLSNEYGTSVNHNIRLLGRRGVMEAQLVCDPEDHATVLAEVSALLEGFQFTSGNSYAEYREGDKIAQYGLAALVTGGAAALALKSGLLQKLLKPLLLGAAAVAVFFKKLWAKITGKA